MMELASGQSGYQAGSFPLPCLACEAKQDPFRQTGKYVGWRIVQSDVNVILHTLEAERLAIVEVEVDSGVAPGRRMDDGPEPGRHLSVNSLVCNGFPASEGFFKCVEGRIGKRRKDDVDLI